MRIAWIGGVSNGGGVGGIGALTLHSVLRAGIYVDYYQSTEDVPEYVAEHINLKIIKTDSWWDWGKWYSKTPFTAFLSSVPARTQTYNQLCEKVVQNHRDNPYDCIFQFSQSEIFKLGSFLDELPPIIVYPCVHAGGELFWHRRESAYARQVESFFMHYLVRVFLTYRTWFQYNELKKPSRVIGMSNRFNEIIRKDYKISADRQDILYHPIRLPSNQDIVESDALAKVRKEVNLLFVSRMSVRKGLQYIIELSHRLEDLEGQVNIKLIGGSTQWSNYTGHLKDLNSKIAQYMESMNRQELASAYHNADVLIIPSLYEPGGIVVGEAVSNGLCVVASDAIGSAEVLYGPAIREFPAGDMDAFEQTVRQLVTEFQAGDRQSLRDSARSQCKEHYDPDKIAKKLISILAEVSGQQDSTHELTGVIKK